MSLRLPGRRPAGEAARPRLAGTAGTRAQGPRVATPSPTLPGSRPAWPRRRLPTGSSPWPLCPALLVSPQQPRAPSHLVHCRGDDEVRQEVQPGPSCTHQQHADEEDEEAAAPVHGEPGGGGDRREREGGAIDAKLLRERLLGPHVLRCPHQPPSCRQTGHVEADRHEHPLPTNGDGGEEAVVVETHGPEQGDAAEGGRRRGSHVSDVEHVHVHAGGKERVAEL
eukprot:747448-Hanusia_phi.AAC.2